ncbi:DUF4838 domain-containing protein [Paenibacillus lignilyticus]|uniref:DUF4838 domain-containing protein n=1 Tax=Paenibacillus lignilyticus TaxID=1172615 RepID=A0ABS5CMT0_9BACL|nr:DUF4838 domain-containing protein [Paenibacillus lignilyticus]MBP3967136.1 DUF4838 domain-containing protein [Paenibacillus lignilyticus]
MKEDKRGILILPEEVGPYWADLIARSGLNLVGIHPGWGAGALEELENMLDVVKTPVFEQFAERMKELNVDLEFESHAMSWLVPRALFSEHPDWFRLDESGNRNPDFNLCASNKAALAFLEERSEELARALPTRSGRYYFWIDDVTNSACHCEECRTLSTSDQAMMFYNHILRGIRRFDETAEHCYLAYQDTIQAPVKVQPDPGIFLEYAPIYRNSAVAIHDPNCPENYKELEHLPGLLQLFGQEGAQILEYWMDNSRFLKWTKPLQALPFYEEVIRQDAEYYRSLGFSRQTSFGVWLGEDYAQEFGEPPIIAYARAIGE